MRFCFITGVYSRRDALIYERQGKSLVNSNFEVFYIVCDDKNDEVVDGIQIISTGFKPKSRFDRFLHTRKYLLPFAIKIDADIYQISDPELISLVSPLKRKKKKVIFNMREYYPDMLKNKYYLPSYFRNTVSKVYEHILKRNLKKYDAVFVVSLKILKAARDKWNVAHCYFLANYPRVDENYSLSYETYCSRGDVLCYEGTIYRTSRQENVFKALEFLPGVRYILAGRIDEDCEYIKELPYWEKVEFINGFEYRELKNIFARSTIANVFRDFGKNDGSLGVIKIFESMEAALPVLMADVPLYREINSRYHCGICVNPNNPQQIKEAISFLVKNKHEAYTMGQNGRQAVVEEFNWESQAEVYIDVVKSILQKNLK